MPAEGPYVMVLRASLSSYTKRESGVYNPLTENI